MKIKQLLECHGIITSLAQQRCSARLAYILKKNLARIQEEMDAFDKARLAGLESIGAVLDEKKGQYDIPKDKKADWLAQYNELVEMETEYKPHVIPLSLLERDNMKISAAEMMSIEWLIEWPNEDEPASPAA